MLRPTFLFVIIVSTIGGLQLFTEPLIFNERQHRRGGTQREFQTLTMYMFENGHRADLSNAGYGAAIAWSLFFLIIAGRRLVNFLLVRRSVK